MRTMKSCPQLLHQIRPLQAFSAPYQRHPCVLCCTATRLKKQKYENSVRNECRGAAVGYKVRFLTVTDRWRAIQLRDGLIASLVIAGHDVLRP